MVKKGVSINRFNTGSVRCPEVYVGMSKLNNKGERMTIVAYHNSSNVDVQFEDGTVKKGISMGNFYTGSVMNPGKYIGMEGKAENGKNMTIIDFQGYRNITVQFEDGSILEGVRLIDFRKGRVKV